MSELTHYVHFDKKSGKILAVGREPEPNFEHAIRVAFEDVEGFLNHRWQFRDYLVGYKRNNDGTSNLGIVQATEQGYGFKHNIFEWISETDEKVECQITWNGPRNRWEFEIDKRVRNYYDVIVAPKLVFFVTLEDDFDFLIRTIFVELNDLITTDIISIPFTHSIEKKIDKISISSKLIFKSYGLRIKRAN
jgi:hypothetical protein